MLKSALFYACTAAALPYFAALAQGPTAPAVETVQIDARAAAQPFPHFWEVMFGSGRANLSLRESYRRDLDATRAVTSVQYVRFHAIFHDENGIYDEDAQGRPVYNFSYLDQIYDGLLDRNVRPFVELGFMPRKLASSLAPHGFWYHPFVSPPNNYAHWDDLIAQFVRHLVARYGEPEVEQWYFEVWNEPNLDFWGGRPNEPTYYELYDHTARAIKSVSPNLRVGGPATAQAAWVDRFIAHCVEQHSPVDFVSTHVYGNDRSEDIFGTHETIPRRDMVGRAVRKVYDQVHRSPRPDLPIIWSEYNASYMNELAVTDSPFMGPWLANNIRVCDGLTTAMSLWTFSDVFEEQGVVKQPFYGGYGLIAEDGIPKAAFNAFRLLHMLGTERIPAASENALVTRDADGPLAIAVWNYAAPEDAGAPREMRLAIAGLNGPHRASIQVVDAGHGSPLAAWESMGRPAFPTRHQIQVLRDAAASPGAAVQDLTPGSPATLSITLQPHALALVRIIP
ncbi:MAG: glycosyl hydrolase family 39 [Bryobacteraceae bacterium]|jgi:xylan 1,4-beta-xylosidase